MASIEQIQSLLATENKKLKDDLGAEVMKQVGALLDSRLAAHEAKLMGEIQALQKRTHALESAKKAEEPTTAGTAAAKRARSEPRTAVAKHELNPLVVLAGFPLNSRKKELEAFVGESLKQRDEWKHLVPFAPSVRSSNVLIKMRSRDEVFEFIQKWKVLDTKFKDHSIRARADTPPQQRKANAKIFRMFEHLKSECHGKEDDADFKRSSVWIGDWEVVKWDQDADQFRWMDDDIRNAGVVINKEEAENATRQQ